MRCRGRSTSASCVRHVHIWTPDTQEAGRPGGRAVTGKVSGNEHLHGVDGAHCPSETVAGVLDGKVESPATDLITRVPPPPTQPRHFRTQFTGIIDVVEPE